ncbi:hypothetical protein BpHYR1_016546 [Brachionus plicatilis]|uniref:Uncharacterized protein n=1 Tax=Brachionus plicatilis TaxID=10195 RepID=A0A3M7T2Z0_BRAPC|nr:hypothetical protein BpHYR1_016546 [Brachionus plicatilis]
MEWMERNGWNGWNGIDGIDGTERMEWNGTGMDAKAKNRPDYLTKLNSEVDLEIFFKQYPKQSSGHANYNNCSDNSDCHKMVVFYPKCKCQKNCITRYLVTKCQKLDQIVVKGVNIHPILNYTEIQTQAKKNKILDSAVCIHLVGCCYLDSIGFPGITFKKFENKNSSQKRKVGP